MNGRVNDRQAEAYFAKCALREALEDYFEVIAAQENPVSGELTELAWDLSQQLRKRPLKTRSLPEQAAPQVLHKLMRRRG